MELWERERFQDYDDKDGNLEENFPVKSISMADLREG